MGFIDSLFNNETVKKTAFGMVKKMMTEQNAKFFVISFQPDGELDGQTYPEGVILIEASKMDRIQQIMEEQERNLTDANEAIDRLGQINIEQATMIEELKKENAALWVANYPAPEQPEPGPVLITTGSPLIDNALNLPNDGNSTATA